MTEQINAIKVDEFLNQVRLLGENQREILLGDASESITTTQGHALMLLAQNGPQTNTELARILHISPAAMTKAMKGLQKIDNEMIIAIPDPEDGRVTRWSLTTAGMALATTHAQCHRETLQIYDHVLEDFSDEEQHIITTFLTALTMRLTEGLGHEKK